MISVAAALDELLQLVGPTEEESVPIDRAHGRVLSPHCIAQTDQPPFDSSAMDGYAIPVADIAPGDTFRVVGESAAGHPFIGDLPDGAAVRVFTGAPVPEGTRRVVIQEDVTRDGDVIRIGDDLDPALYIRRRRKDFTAGFRIDAPHRIDARTLALLGAMGHDRVQVRRRPVIGIMATGDELRHPGKPLDPGAIHTSNTEAIAAMLTAEGAEARRLPIARDTVESLASGLALAEGVDVLITTGGASVGDHDLVSTAATAAGIDLRFQKVAMRPGKPVMAGRGPAFSLVGLPGNPVSSMVCTVIFILPMIRRMLGLSPAIAMTPHPLAEALPQNGPRAHYMRARLEDDGRCVAAPDQDSSLLSVLAAHDHLIVRPPHDPARAPGDMVDTIAFPG